MTVQWVRPAVTVAVAALEGLRTGPTCSHWATLRGLRTEGIFLSGGLRFRFEKAVDTRSGSFALRWHDGAGTPPGAQGAIGSRSWSSDDSGATHTLNSPHEHALATSQQWIERRGWCAPGFGGAAIAGTKTIRDGPRSLDAVAVTPRGGQPIDIWIDRATHLLAATVTQLAETREIDVFSDWRTVAGAAIPFRDEVRYPEDEQVDVFTTTRATATGALPKTAFLPAPTPADVVMLHGATSTTVPYRIEAQKPLIDVWLNGKGPFPFVVDTGGHFILSRQTAERLGLRPSGAMNSLGQGTGVFSASFARVAQIRIGDAVIKNQVAKIIPYSYSRLERGTKPPKAGWLGLQFFERFQVTLNPRTMLATLTPLSRARRPTSGIRIPLLFEEDAPVVACRIEGHPGMCMVDTGNQGETIVEGRWLERAGLTAHLRHGLDLGDGLRVDRARIELGPLSFDRELVEFSPAAVRGSESTVAVAAILSQDMIDRYVTTFDYRDGAMWLVPLGVAPAPYDRTGIGAQKDRDGAFVVTSIFPESPAARAGLRRGDRITTVDGVPAAELSSADLFTEKRGPAGALRRYGIMRGAARFDVSIRLRDLI